MVKTTSNKLTIYTAELDYPTGVNSTYAGTKGGLRKTPQAQKWFDNAVASLRKQGFSALPDEPYWASISYFLRTVQMDLDGPTKSIVDAISESLSLTVLGEEWYINKYGKKKKRKTKKVLGFNDRWVGNIEEYKERVDHYVDQGLTVRVILARVKDKDVFNQVTALVRNKDYVFEQTKKLAKAGLI